MKLEHDSLMLGTATLHGSCVHVLAQDARVEGGSFGARESDAVAAWLHAVRQRPAPLVLMLDSGGARVNEGLAALGGFRRLFAALADTWLAGVPMLAVCGRNVFGGASMLACLAQGRVFFERSLFGMSGPRIVQAIAGASDFDASDRGLLSETMGGAARAGRGQGTLVADDLACVRAACAAHCAVGTFNAKSALDALLIAQRQTLERDALTRLPAPQKIPTAQLGPIALRNAWTDDGVLIGRATDDGFVYGLVDGVWADSWHAWKLTNALMAQLDTAPQAPAHIVLDCPAHATNRALEAGMISQYFSLLGLAVRALHHANRGNVTLHIVGEAAGGVHVALAGGASRVVAYEKTAYIRILPQAALEQVRPGTDREFVATARTWIEAGVTDALE
jgi:hypothetical protein